MHAAWARFVFALFALNLIFGFNAVASAQFVQVQPATVQELSDMTGTEWAGVYVFGQKAGFAKISNTLEGGRFTVEMEMSVTVRAFGNTQKMILFERKIFDVEKDRLWGQDVRFEQGTQKINVRLRVIGDKAVLTRDLAGEVSRDEIDAPQVLLSENLAPSLLVRRGLAEIGTRTKGQFFEAMPPFSRTLEFENTLLEKGSIQVGGVPLVSYTWKTRVLDQGTEIESVMDAHGSFIKTTMMKMMVLRAEPEHVAKSQMEVPDVLNLSMVRVGRELGNPSSLSSLTLRIHVKDPPEALLSSNGHVLERTDNTVLIHFRRRELPTNPPVNQPEIPREFLIPSPMIQSDHPEIKRATQEVLVGVTSPHQKVQRLIKYVHHRVAKSYRAHLSNALDVHRNPIGDCTEHTVLFVAMARAAGLPARSVMGLTYTQSSGGGFGGHAWAEVYLSGKWYPVDPTANQETADPSHIPLAAGNLEEMPRIMQYIGNIKIDVLAVVAR